VVDFTCSNFKFNFFYIKIKDLYYCYKVANFIKTRAFGVYFTIIIIAYLNVANLLCETFPYLVYIENPFAFYLKRYLCDKNFNDFCSFFFI
jgi:hypothetical protein